MLCRVGWGPGSGGRGAGHARDPYPGAPWVPHVCEHMGVHAVDRFLVGNGATEALCLWSELRTRGKSFVNGVKSLSNEALSGFQGMKSKFDSPRAKP